MNPRLLSFCAFLLGASGVLLAAQPALPEPGPENSGLRLRWVVQPGEDAKSAGYTVRVDLLNVGQKAIQLEADWLYDSEKGSLKDYLEAAVSIEAQPPMAPWEGQIMGGRRQVPQPKQLLKVGEAIIMQWQTEGNRFKNQVSNQLEVQNPEFVFPGQYSVHASLTVKADGKDVTLRSNEQLLVVGGSREQPKSTFGNLLSVDEKQRTAVIDLGSEQKVAVGDVFQIRTGMFDFWKLTITVVKARQATGDLLPLPVASPEIKAHSPKFPTAKLRATLYVPDAIDRLESKLSSSHGLWMNGLFPMIDLPPDTPAETVAKQVFEKTGFDTGRITEFKILKQRYIFVKDASSERYLALQLKTNLGEKILLIQKPLREGGSWWSRVYSVE